MSLLKKSKTVSANRPLVRTNLWQRWKPLVLKELRETLRDTRTVGTLFLMPLLVYPLISLLMQNFIPRDLDPETTAKFQIGLDSSATLEYLRDKLGAADDSIRQEQYLMSQQAGLEPQAPSLATEPEQLTLNQQEWSILEGAQDFRRFVSEGTVDVVLKLRPIEADAPGEPVLELLYDPTREFSRSAAAYIALRVERYNLRVAHTSLAIARIPARQMLTRLEIAVEPAKTSSVSFATLIPLILIMMTITGAVYPAIDLTAGERERGTLESLMAAPVPRVGILAAKYVAVWTVAMLTASLNVISMLVTLWVMQLDTVFLGSDGITLAMVGPMFGLLGLFAFFFSAILLVITSAARSFKEAQAYLIPLMMLSLTPGALAMMPNLKAELWMAFVPMVNLVVLSRDVMLGAVVADFALLSIVCTLLYSAAALSLAAQVFGSDAVLYGSQGSWRELLQKNRTQRIPSPAFALLVLALLFPTQFVMLGVLGRLQPQATALSMIGMMTLFTFVLFLLLPVAAVLGRGFALVPTFALQRPTWSAALGGTLLGLGLWPLVGLSLWALSQWRAWMLGTEAAAWSNQVVQLALQQTGGWAELPKGVLVLCLAIVPAICEEWFFRGLLLQSLRSKNRDWVAIVLSGVAFGLFHFVVESSVAPLRFFVTAVLGMVLAWVCLRSGSLWPGVLLHGINNGILTTLALSREALQASPPSTTVVASVLVGCFLSLMVGFWLLSRSRALPIQRALVAALLLVSSMGYVGLARAQDGPLPKTAPGFLLHQYAADNLAHDIHGLALGPDDEVFVAGPGYLGQLIDTNLDGVADQFAPVSFQPRQGAQGLLVERDWLWVVADQAIWQVPRTPGENTRKWMELPKTGGEHDFHSLRRGNDGWLYFLAGNHAQIDSRFITSPLPIARPLAGVVGRISPDGQIRQVLVHGMRNAYGFDFDLDGSFLLYDSDDERDAGLPWYRPTTLFSAVEGADLGWVSRCFKKPTGTLGAATIRAETGRGSPTGVAVQRGLAFGPDYFGSVAFADWTFGRVYLQRRANRDHTIPPEILVESQSGGAFAPTSMAFDSRGHLWIATGGRNTSGAVFVVQRDAAKSTDLETETIASKTEAITDLALWFASMGSPSKDSTFHEQQLIPWSNVIEQQDKLTEALQKWESYSSPQELGNLRAAGQRLLLRTYVLRQPQSWEAAAQRAELREQVSDLDPQWWPEVVTWLAMSGASLSPGEFVFEPAIGARQLLAMTMQNDPSLWKSVHATIPGDRNDTIMSATLAIAALAQRNSTQELSADQHKIVAQLFASELQRATDGQPTHLSWADWLLVWRWALRAPVLGDGQTSPWDFMRRQSEVSADETTRQAIIQGLDSVWRPLLAKEAGGQAPSPQQSSDPNEAAPQGLLNSVPQSWQHLLEIQLLLGLDASSLPNRWQAWFELQEASVSPDQLTNDEWHPVQRTQAMVLLAAMPQPWSTTVVDLVADYLLNVDQQLARWNISTDRNWQQRFDELGRLLCLDHLTLQNQLAESPQWQRATQIPLVSFLAFAQQPAVMAKLMRTTPDWEPRVLDSSLLDLMAETVEKWRLRRTGATESDELVDQVRAWISQVRAAQDQRFAQQQPALTDTELANALRQLETNVPWEQGDAPRGKLVYERRNCQLCHGQNGRLGPALSGVSRRFQRREVLTVILHPDSRITDRYQPLWIEKTDGTLLIGRPIYESTDGVLLEDQQGKTWQLSRSEIEWSRPAPRSLMPTGLMTDATGQDWADLWAFLMTL